MRGNGQMKIPLINIALDQIINSPLIFQSCKNLPDTLICWSSIASRSEASSGCGDQASHESFLICGTSSYSIPEIGDRSHSVVPMEGTIFRSRRLPTGLLVQPGYCVLLCHTCMRSTSSYIILLLLLAEDKLQVPSLKN